jgi:N-acyl-D-aspartate/D-glutamate deacylase
VVEVAGIRAADTAAEAAEAEVEAAAAVVEAAAEAGQAGLSKSSIQRTCPFLVVFLAEVSA